MISSQKYWSEVFILQIKKNLFDIKLIFTYEEKYTYYKAKKAKKVYVTVLLFILYSIWVHVESPKYKMICLKLPKSSEFAIRLTNSGKISLTTLILSFLTTINWFLKIEKKKRNPWVLRLRNTCALRCSMKTAENAFKVF